MDNLDNLLAWRQAAHNLMPHGTLADALDKILDNFEVYIGLQKGQTYFAHCLVNIRFG
jgi:hypothetical protein